MKEITCIDGTKLRRISRWIKLRQNYSPSKRNSLWDYVSDSAGYHPYSDKFDPSDGLYLDYFVYKGQTYALDQFYILGSFFLTHPPYMYYDENGKLAVIGTMYMDGSIWGPAMYGEWDECCEYVRLYEEVKE